ncbi:AhpD-like protein [Mycotypha africana]|uniref:AhpD-like protein n=1 Tax=Mycotypha africana TaxID=64632 RepID=UPI0022FFD876|nr:AhpD-like protein [Mycotypha africana]KAI8987761.1 AhpD-like protein [Mycotypha africana]
MSVIELLNNIANDEQNLTNDYWYLIAVAIVMSSVNKPEDIQYIYQTIEAKIDNLSQQNESKKNNILSSIVLRLREAVLKSHVIIGFPKTINTLQQLSIVTPDHVKALLPKKPLRNEEKWADVQFQRQRGKALFNKIYDRHAEKVMNNMYQTHPDLAQTALHHLYGPTLSETSILDAKETSLITVAGLMIQNIPLQLKGHSYGALHNGATEDDLRRVQSIVTILSEHYQCTIAKL